MCDSCKRSICESCVSRNFGRKEMIRLKQLKPWFCFSCIPNDAFVKLQVADEVNLFSVERAYGVVRPPACSPALIYNEIKMSLSQTEEKITRYIVGVCDNSAVATARKEIFECLHASDVIALKCLSKKIHKLFQMLPLTPGLFKTDASFYCELHSHQYASLNLMTDLEHRDRTFGSLRGGILADEPGAYAYMAVFVVEVNNFIRLFLIFSLAILGLGKTVTALALIASTAGTLPQVPSSPVKPSDEDADHRWRSLCEHRRSEMEALVNRLAHCLPVEEGRYLYLLDTLLLQMKAPGVSFLRSQLEFERHVRNVIRSLPISARYQDIMLTKFRQGEWVGR